MLTRYSDPIHGTIRLLDLEKEIATTPWFRRLQHIRQLGALAFVFPSATHTRFAHSLGVMNYAGQMYARLRYPDQLPPQELETDPAYRAVRLAGMLHDIGHAPFSHNLEHAFEREFSGEGTGATAGEDPGKEYREHDLLQGVDVNWTRDPFHHETIGQAVVRRAEDIWGPLLKEGLGEQVLGILTGNVEPMYLKDIISGGLDADKLDYLQRDSGTVGLGYGAVDVDRLQTELTLYGENLGIRSTAITPLQHFQLARYFWYSGIVSHTKVNALEELFNAVYYDLTKRKFKGEERSVVPNLLEYLGTVHRTIEKGREGDGRISYYRFDDSYVIAQLHKALERRDELEPLGAETPLTDAALETMLRHLVHGTPYQLVCRVDSVDPVEDGTPSSHPWVTCFDEFRVVLKENLADHFKNGEFLIVESSHAVLKAEKQPPVVTEPIQLLEDDYEVTVANHPSGFLSALPGEVIAEGPDSGEDVTNHEIALLFHARRVYCVEAIRTELRNRWEDHLRKCAPGGTWVDATG